MTQQNISIYTDGACSGNPGPGGWGVFMQCGERTKELSGGVSHTTNQQMELQAAIEALKALKQPDSIATIHSDSKYVVDGITQWIIDWKKRGWKTSKKKAIANLEQWKELDALNALHSVTWQWVKGHAGNEGNEQADTLATNAVPNVNDTPTDTANILSIQISEQTHILSCKGESFNCQCGNHHFSMYIPDEFVCKKCRTIYKIQQT